MKSLLLSLVTALALIAAQPGVLWASRQAQETDAASLVNSLTEAFNARDADTVLGLFTEDATVSMFNPQFEGDREIITAEEWANRLETATEQEMPSDLRMSVVGVPQVNGDRVTWTWRQTAAFLSELNVDHLDFTVEAHLSGGKFHSLEIVPTPESLSEVPLGGAPGMPRTGASDLTVALALVLLSLSLISAGMAFSRKPA